MIHFLAVLFFFPAAAFFFVLLFLALLLGVAAFWGVAEADPAAADDLLGALLVFLAPAFLIFLDPVAFLVLLVVLFATLPFATNELMRICSNFRFMLVDNFYG